MYDLLLKGGTVVDPAQSLHRIMDVAITQGRIARLAPTIAAVGAKQVVDATGKIVIPGMVDLHTHVYWGGTPLGAQADLVGPATGVTTFVDAGSAGAGSFVAFKEHIIDAARVRILAFLHISFLGLHGAIYDPTNMVIVGESFDIRYAMLQPAIEVSRAYPDLIKGIKVRVSLEASGEQGVRPLLLALQAAEDLGLPVMVHIGVPPPSRREVLSLLREGDILSHAFRGHPNSPLDRQGRVFREMVDARERGVIMDVGHGGSSFSWNVAREMLDQGFPPDVISSDLHLGLSVKTSGWPGMPSWNLPTTMSKMLSLGMSLDDVIRASTCTPAQVIGCEGKFGSLRQGSVAEVTVLALEEGKFEFEDMYSGRTIGNKQLAPVITVLGGQVFNTTEPYK